jgi:hypothetical protein
MHRMNLMIRLGRSSRERGAVASIVAIFLGTGVILGAAALSIDIGSLMFERRQLQNGADASALALAKTCAETPAQCTVAANATNLQNLNDANNYRDKAGGFNSTYPNGVCGRGTLTLLPPCNAPTGDLSDCPALPDFVTANPAIPYVEVHTITRETNNSPLLPPQISQSITGNTAGQTVGACSRAAWGTPRDSTAELPITVSGCDWEHATGGNAGGGGGAYYPAPVYNGSSAYGYGSTGQPAWPTAAATPPAQNLGQEIILMLANPPSGQVAPSPCPNWQGHALPGGFGMLEHTSASSCEVKVYPNDWLHTDPGSSVSCDLSAAVGTIVNLPVFDCTHDSLPPSAVIPPAGGDCTLGGGSNSWYHKQGWTQFYLSGYHMTTTGSIPNGHKSLVSNQFPCNGGESCISGWFVTGSLSTGTISGPPGGPGSFGSPVVQSAG